MFRNNYTYANVLAGEFENLLELYYKIFPRYTTRRTREKPDTVAIPVDEHCFLKN
jgi:hypothetical protein